MSRPNVYESCFIDNLQIPDKALEHRPRETVRDSGSSSPQSPPSDHDSESNYITSHKGQNGRPAPRPRRLSTYEDGDALMDPESGKTRTTSSSSTSGRV